MEAIFLFIIAVVFIVAYIFRPRDPNLPPGARPLPIVGNLLSLIQTKYIQKQLKADWAKWGDLESVYLGSHLAIAVHGYKSIYEALVTKADVFSGRPKSLPAIESFSHGKGVLTADGESWRKMRRFTLMCLRDLGFGKKYTDDNIKLESQFLINEVEKMDGQVWERPITLFNKTTANIISCLIFGQRFEYTDPDFIEILDKLRIASRSGTNIPPEYVFPVFKYIRKLLPLKQRSGLLMFAEHARSFAKKQIEEHRKTFDPDNIRSYIDMYLKVATEGKENIDEEDIFATIIDLFLAGTETSATTLDWALLYMIEHPEVQERCQKEIDQVIGHNRSVSWSDRTSLPFTQATVYEIQRFSSIVPLGVPHACTEETMFQGFRIPAETIILTDLYSALHDPEQWENPDVFSPERFLGDNDNVKKIDALIPFSAGPHVCLGESLARMEIFVFFANLLQQFHLSAIAPIDWSTETFCLSIRGAPTYHLKIFKRE